MMIAAMGVPGCGKTTTFTDLAGMYKLPVFTEPDEDQWPEGIKNYKSYPSGSFTMFQWFRSQRLPQWYRAHEMRSRGPVLIDSCYDLLLWYYLDCSSMDWLIDQDDPYRWLIRGVAFQDKNTLPQPDTIVFFHMEFDPWVRNLERRGRSSDKCPMMRSNFEALQRDMYNATVSYCQQHSVRLVDFTPLVGDNLMFNPEVGLDWILNRHGIKFS